MRLIDADALKEAWCERCDNRHLCGDKAGCDEVKELYAMPTIEAEPITTEKAVEHLMRTKWFQEHDTAMIEKGMERQKKLTEPRKHGHWEKLTEADADGNVWYSCSICNRGDLHAEEAVVPYCWYCGARMDEKICPIWSDDEVSQPCVEGACDFACEKMDEEAKE